MIRALLHGLALIPFLWLAWQHWLWFSFLDHALTANPQQFVNQFTGEWAIRFLLASLAITPLRQLFKKNNLIKYRRMLGLYAFFYACLHLVNFVVLDHFFDWQTILEDILKRNAITFGMIAFLLLLPLAITSTKKMVRRLGKKWAKLHKLVYGAGILTVVHNLMMVKVISLEEVIHATLLGSFLGYRLWHHYGKRKT